MMMWEILWFVKGRLISLGVVEARSRSAALILWKRNNELPSGPGKFFVVKSKKSA